MPKCELGHVMNVSYKSVSGWYVKHARTGNKSESLSHLPQIFKGISLTLKDIF